MINAKNIETCVECCNKATWLRRTQFAGDHPYCDDHARKQEDFRQEDSYEYWEESKNGFLFKNRRYVTIDSNT